MGKRYAWWASWLLIAPMAASAQLVGVALDAKVQLVDGEVTVLPSPPPDSTVFLRFDGTKADMLGRVAVPTSFQGPPSSVALTADGTLALVSAFRRVDPTDPAKLAPDYRVSVIDLRARPHVAQTLVLDASPSSIAIHPAGTMALVMHASDDSMTVLSIANGRASVTAKVKLDKGSAPIAAACSPDGRRVLVTLPDQGRIALFAAEEDRLRTPAIREMSAGIYPVAVAWCGRSGLAVVANYGKVTGDSDTISLLDVTTDKARVIDTASVGPAPEGVACSPDGRHAAAAVQNMSTSPSDPFHVPHSKLVVLRITDDPITGGHRLQRMAEVPFGAWAQGVGFLDDSRTLFAQSMMANAMYLFRIDEDALRVAAPPIVFEQGAPAGFGIAR